jgi:hypothetical protein
MILCFQPFISLVHAAQNDLIFTLSLQKPLRNYQAMIRAERVNPKSRWFDDQPSHGETMMVELGLQLPKKGSIRYRNYTIRGIHQGEASQYSCTGILGCFWTSGSIQDNLTSDESIAYELKNNELWVEHDFQFHHPFTTTIAPAVGINLLPATLSILGSGQHESKQATLPIPFIGLRISTPISEQITLTGEIHQFQYDNSRWGLQFRNLQAGIRIPIADQITLSVGYVSYRMNIQYHRNNTHAGLDLPMNSPFIKISTQF